MSIANMIDHTALKPNTTRAIIEKLCLEAKTYNFASVCVNPTWVKFAAEQLKGTDVKVCTVIGFPLGANTPEVKAFETTNAINNGADEVDMVINIGALIDRDLELVEKDIRAVVEASRGKALNKVIIETSLLTEEEKVLACAATVAAGADFIKTSTGFAGGGATKEDIALLRKHVGPKMGVKASGGVRNADDAKAVIAAGATRIGASAGVEICEGLTAGSDY